MNIYYVSAFALGVGYDNVTEEILIDYVLQFLTVTSQYLYLADKLQYLIMVHFCIISSSLTVYFCTMTYAHYLVCGVGWVLITVFGLLVRRR